MAADASQHLELQCSSFMASFNYFMYSYFAVCYSYVA